MLGERAQGSQISSRCCRGKRPRIGGAAEQITTAPRRVLCTFLMSPDLGTNPGTARVSFACPRSYMQGTVGSVASSALGVP